MRRAKDHRGNPKPLTWSDIREVLRFEQFLRDAKGRQEAGATREQAQQEAYAATYPEQEPN